MNSYSSNTSSLLFTLAARSSLRQGVTLGPVSKYRSLASSGVSCRTLQFQYDWTTRFIIPNCLPLCSTEISERDFVPIHWLTVPLCLIFLTCWYSTLHAQYLNSSDHYPELQPQTLPSQPGTQTKLSISKCHPHSRLSIPLYRRLSTTTSFDPLQHNQTQRDLHHLFEGHPR